MAQVILIYPSGGYPNLTPPLGLLHLAAVLLEKNFSVKIIDSFHSDNWSQEIENAVDKETLCLGVSTMSGDQQKGARETAQLFKKRFPHLPVVFGGVHPTLDPNGTLTADFVDFICIGEGEQSFVSLVQHLYSKTPFDPIPGIGFKRDGQLIITPASTEYYDLNKLPLLPYELLDLSKYNTTLSSWYNNEGAAFIIETSRGCYYRCYYCVQSVYKQKVRQMSQATILKHIDHAVHWGAKYLIVADDNFFNHPKAPNVILPTIRSKFPHLPFFFPVRVNLITDELCRLLITQPPSMLGISTESGSDHILTVMKKKTHADDSLMVNRLLKKHDIDVSFNFIIGFPEETLTDIMASYSLMIKLLKGNNRARIAINKLIPTPASSVYKECVARGFPEISKYEDWEEIRHLSWDHITFLDPQIVAWEKHTRYFIHTCQIIDKLRNRPQYWKKRWRHILFLPLQKLVFICIYLRIRRSFHGKSIDSTLLGRLLYLYDKYIFSKIRSI